MYVWRLAGAMTVTLALLGASAAGAKDLAPGDLRVCNATRCVPIADRAVLRSLSAFLYGTRPAPQARRVRAGAPTFALRFRNGYLAGIVGSPKLDRVLVNGLNCGRFRRGVWYRLPARAVREVRRLAALLQPVRLTRARVPRSC